MKCEHGFYCLVWATYPSVRCECCGEQWRTYKDYAAETNTRPIVAGNNDALKNHWGILTP